MALIAECTLKSTSPLSMSRHYIDPPKKEKESPANYDDRTWRERLHYNEQGIIFIPNMAIKWCLTDSAKLLGMKVGGRGNTTYSKFFESGILVLDHVLLGVHKDNAVAQRLFVPANGKHGSGTRVWRTFPVLHEWTGVAKIYVINPIITRSIFEEHLEEAGRFIGLGRFRPQRGGFFGRFELVPEIKWSEE